jgi:hypothetical protein
MNSLFSFNFLFASFLIEVGDNDDDDDDDKEKVGSIS